MARGAVAARVGLGELDKDDMKQCDHGIGWRPRIAFWGADSDKGLGGILGGIPDWRTVSAGRVTSQLF